MINRFLLSALLLLSLFTGWLTSQRLCAAEISLAEQEELLDKTQAALLWFHSLDSEYTQNRTPPQTYRDKITPIELLQAAALLSSYRKEEQNDLVERIFHMISFYRLTPEEHFEIYDVLGDAALRELSGIGSPFIESIPVEAEKFRKQTLSGTERVILYQTPETVLEVMKAIDVLSVVGRPVLVRYYLRRLLSGEYALTPEKAARIVETIGTQKLMQLAIHPEFVPLGKEAVAKIIDEAKKHWQDPERIAEALKETQWFTDGARAGGISPPVSPQIRPEALPALRVLWKGDHLSVQQVFEKLGTLEDEREADELTAVLLSLRPDMKEALAATLWSLNAKLRFHAARGLAASVTQQDSFLLYPFLFIENILPPGAEEEAVLSDTGKEVVRNILQQRRIAVPSQEQAAAILFERATDYFERRRPLRTDADGLVSYWLWGARGDEESTMWQMRVNIENGYKEFATRYYRQSYDIVPKTSANYKTYKNARIIAALERLGHTSFGLPVIVNHLRGLEKEDLEPLLQQSLEKDSMYAATQVIEWLKDWRDDVEDLLKSTDGRPRILVQATVAEDRRVRFAALEAIMKIMFSHESRERNNVERPDDEPNDPVAPAIAYAPGFHGPFAGSSLVADTLVWFSRSEGQSVILSGHPQMATANQTASLFLGLGYQTDVATTCRDLFRLAAASPDVEAVFVDARTPQPPVGEFVQVMRQDARTAEIPIAVLGSDVTRAGGISPPVTQPRDSLVQNRGTNARPLFGEYPRLASEEAARWVLDDLFDKTGVRIVPPDVRLEQAKQALRWLREIKLAELESGVKIYHFDDFDAVVLNALHSERRVREGLDLAAVVKSAALQSAIYELAANVIYPMELREYAADAFENSVQTFGVLLRGVQIQRLYDRYNASEFEIKESQDLLSRLIDVVKEKTEEK